MVSDEPIRQQSLEAEIDQAFHEVFETDQPNPIEDNPHAAVFDEMADDLYQTMLQEQAKEEAAAGLRPAQTNAAATGWTNDGSIQYNDSGDTAFSQQEYLRQFWDETKQRFSAVKLLFDTQPYGSFQPAFAVADGKGLPNYSNDDIASHVGAYTSRLGNFIKQFAMQKKQQGTNSIVYEDYESTQKKNPTKGESKRGLRTRAVRLPPKQPGLPGSGIEEAFGVAKRHKAVEKSGRPRRQCGGENRQSVKNDFGKKG